VAVGGALEAEADNEGKREEEVLAAADAAGGAPKSEPAEGAGVAGAGVAPKGFAGAEAGVEPKLEGDK